jgi:uncharacterized lipoprotein YajG
MSVRIREVCAVVLVALVVVAGCSKPAGSEKKVAPAQPLPNTTDSK